MQTEPARLVGAIVGVAAAVIALLIAFGIDITDQQSTAIYGFIAAVGVIAPLVSGFITRNKVYAPNTVQAIANQVGKDPAPATDPNTGNVVIPDPPATSSTLAERQKGR